RDPKPGPGTPTTMAVCPSRSTDLPTTVGSPPKRRRQNALLRMIIVGTGGGGGAAAAGLTGCPAAWGGGVGATASASVKPRPRATRAPRIDRRLGVTPIPLTCSGL